MNRWIPAIEKLPEKDELYIVTFDGELAGQKEPFTSANYFENGKWDSDGDCVLAWMPLPEPYRPEDKGGRKKTAWGDRVLGDFMKNAVERPIKDTSI